MDCYACNEVNGPVFQCIECGHDYCVENGCICVCDVCERLVCESELDDHLQNCPLRRRHG